MRELCSVHTERQTCDKPANDKNQQPAKKMPLSVFYFSQFFFYTNTSNILGICRTRSSDTGRTLH